MRRPGVAAILAAAVLVVASAACDRAAPSPAPSRSAASKPGEVIEILPDDIRPADHLARVPFAPIQEPVALLGGSGRGDVDVLGATPAASGIEVYRVHGDSEPPTVEVRNEFNVPMPDSVVGVSAAVRQPAGRRGSSTPPPGRPMGSLGSFGHRWVAAPGRTAY
jgi:hypothetical protein